MAFSDDDRYDDDVNQDDGYEGFPDEDDQDDAPASPRDRIRNQINPYSAKPDAPNAPGSRGSPFRSTDSPGSSGSGSRPGYGGSYGSGGGGSGSTSGSGSRGPGNPFSSGGGSGSGSSNPYGSSSGPRQLGASGASNPPPSRSTGTFSSSSSRPSSPGSDRPSYTASSAPPSRSTGENSPYRSPSESTPYSRPGDRRDDRPSSASSRPADSKPAAKPDDKSGGRGIGGFFGRGKDDKPDAKKDAGRPQQNRPPDKKKDDGGGKGIFGVVSNRFGRGGDKQAAKPDAGRGAPASSSSYGRSASPPNKPDRKPASGDKAAGAGGLSALTGRIGGIFKRGGDKDAKPGAKPPGRDASPGQPLASMSGSRSAPPSAQSGARQQQPPSRAAAAERGEGKGGLWEALTSRLRGGGKADAQPQSRTRREGTSNRVPEVTTAGWNLDTQLDLVGIGLMVGALILLLSSLSGDQGAAIGAVNTFLGQVFGWGAIVVPFLMGGIGAFLLVTRFGDTPPEIDAVRVAGAVSFYVALLTLFQFIVVLDPLFQGDLATMKLLVDGYTWGLGRGGGVIGTGIHLFLVENIGEIGGFVLLAGWMGVSLMLFTRTSATQLIVIIVSLTRSFRVSWQHRQQLASARRAVAQQEAAARAAAQRQIAVSKPNAGELRPGTAGALPAGEARQQPLPLEDLPIRVGGQMVSAETAAAASVPAAAGARGAFGGLLKRLPGSGSRGTQSDSEAETAPTGGARGFLSRRAGSTFTNGALEGGSPAAAPPPPPPSSVPPSMQPAALQHPAAPAPSPAYAPYQQPTQTPAPANASSTPSPQPVPPGPAARPIQPAPQPAQSTPEPATRQPSPYGPSVQNNTPISTPKPPSIETHRPKRSYTMVDFRTLLAPGSKGDYDRKALVERARIIGETLESFGAPGKVVEINTGPVITQFGVEPGYITQRDRQSRVKVSAIAQLDKDLQLALGARSIRIEAPVPGKGYVGIEVPNDTPMTVSLRDLMESNRYQRIKSPLAIALGEAVDGTPVAADLSSMPHLLIAGTTGSGKSVMVNAIICSLLLRNTPDVVRFIMVDPKRVELTTYNGIPHLVAPVVVEVERIIGVLKWVTREMDDRYKRFSVAGARNIDDYNRNRAAEVEQMPYIIVVIDELADLMMLAPEEAERYITRIAAMARATGIHLVIATQRPSADVVTGLIKANFPARIAFAVASNVDSRVILDQPGAEKLLGRGDMLYLSGDSPAPVRLQGVFLSDQEIQTIVKHWKAQSDGTTQTPLQAFAAADKDDESKQASGFGATAGRGMASSGPIFPQKALFDEDDEDDGDESGEDMPDDELYERAVDLVRRQNGASVSLLQRKMRIGYARAARLIDAMEDRGIIGPAKEGSSKQRDVLPAK
ncbi:MAG: DUF87 domain-containing protein [Chloroflexi bacterium]|nr:DUF87 domain-containing protein [Chloroflexota bacterium]